MKFVLIIVFLLWGIEGFGQEPIKKNEVYAELLGNGLLGSINYSRALGDKPGFSVHAGLGVYGGDAHLSYPVGVNYIIRLTKNDIFLDLGLGATYTKSDGSYYASVKRNFPYTPKTEYVYIIPNLGFRSFTSKNFVWHLNITPVFSDVGVLPAVGLGFGKRF